MTQRHSHDEHRPRVTSRKAVRIPEATVVRLPLYYRALLGLSDMDVPTVSSDQLALMSGVNAAKVRKDLSYLGSYGTRGVGYDVQFLLNQIGKELGLDRQWTVAIVGVGNLGSALANYKGFEDRGFRVAALFDADLDKIGTTLGGLLVSPVEDLEQICKQKGVEIGIVAVPARHAQDVTDKLVSAGVKSILNFAPIEVRVPEDVVVRKVDVAVELQILAFYTRQDLTRTGLQELGDRSALELGSPNPSARAGERR